MPYKANEARRHRIPRARYKESMQNRGGDHAAAGSAAPSFAGRKPGWRRRKASSSVSFSTAVRTSRKGCTVALFQRICCRSRLWPIPGKRQLSQRLSLFEPVWTKPLIFHAFLRELAKVEGRLDSP